MHLRAALVASTLLLTAILAGCAEKGTTPTTSAPSDTKVDIKTLQFQPKEITIKVGGKVTWTNKDAMNHDVTADDGSWGSDGGKGGMATGGVFSKTFDAAGTFAYHCEEHKGSMPGKVTVTA